MRHSFYVCFFLWHSFTAHAWRRWELWSAEQSCLNIVCVHTLIRLFVDKKLLTPLLLPCSDFSFVLQLYSPLQMAWFIQLDVPQVDSLIKVASKHSASLCFFPSFPAVTGEFLPREHHKPSCHLHLPTPPCILLSLSFTLLLSGMVQHCPHRYIWVMQLEVESRFEIINWTFWWGHMHSTALFLSARCQSSQCTLSTNSSLFVFVTILWATRFHVWQL